MRLKLWCKARECSEASLKIIVYGAGVIGTLYAARLQEGGHRVTVVARGQRLADIRRYGLVLEDIVGHGRSTTRVDTIERVVALISVRRDQVASVVPEFTTNHRIPILFFMLNNPTGTTDLAQALGRDRVLLGFPGAGVTRDGHVVRYAMIAQQPTTLGELDGRRTARLRELVEMFRQSGFRTTTSRDMDAWLKAHAFFVTAVSGAIYMAGGDCHRLSEDKATVVLMAKGVREGYAAVRALGLSVAPFALRVLFTWLPSAFAIYYWRRFFASKMADYVFGRHARAASGEMRELATTVAPCWKRAESRPLHSVSFTGLSTPMQRRRLGSRSSVRGLAAGKVSKTLHPGCRAPLELDNFMRLF
jgi:2-dehydropantoate 2-reductase